MMLATTRQGGSVPAAALIIVRARDLTGLKDLSGLILFLFFASSQPSVFLLLNK